MSSDLTDDEPNMVIVCAGPPVCELQDDAAVAAAEAGCPHCTRIAVYPDGEQVDQTVKGGRA